MRRDHGDPGQSTGKPRAEDWQPELAEPARVDTGDAGAVVRECTERAAPVTAGDPWLDIKSRFVDDPAGAVAAAEQLVRQAVDERIRELQDEAAAVCAAPGEDPSSTEGLRTRLIGYQVYCQRLAGVVH